MSVLAKRIKSARLSAGLSQEALGLAAGLDEMSASTRMNRYELGKRVPTPDLVEKFGDVLGVSAAFFYAVEEDEAELILKYHKLDSQSKSQVLDYVRGLQPENG